MHEQKSSDGKEKLFANLHLSEGDGDIDNCGDDHDHDFDSDEIIPGIKFVNYRDESQLDSVMRLVGRDLSEPYSVFTYRYFLHRFPELCIFAVPTTSESDSNESTEEPEPIGCVVCKIDPEESDETEEQQTSSTATSTASGGTGAADEIQYCGYMAMLAVDNKYRRSGIGTALVKRAVRRMKQKGCRSVLLETEVTNEAAMRLYEERLGFMKEELLVRYYLNWGDAYRLRLWLK